MITIVGYRPLAIDYEVNAPFANTKSLLFDGVIDYVDCGVITTLQSASQYSLSCWFKTSNVAKTQGILKWYYRTNDWIEISIISGVIYFIPLSLDGYATFPASAISNDIWYNIIMVFDGTTTGNINRLKAYVNGIELLPLTYLGTIVNTTTTMIASTFKIGERYIGTDYFLGNIDEVSIYDYSLSSAEALAIGGTIPTDLSLLSTPPTNWYRNGDNGSWKSPQWLIPNNENKDKVSNYSLDFDGVGDYLTIANNTTIARTQNISYSIWVNLDVTSGQYILGNQSSSNGGSGLSIETGDVLLFQMADGGNDSYFNSRVANFSTYAPVNTWNHILATWDGTDSKIYINGVLRNTWSPVLPYVISNYSTFWIARRSANTNNTLNGNLDEAVLFDSAISIGDVWDGSGEPIDVSAVSGITNYYKMGENATFAGGVWTVPDEVGINNGTSANMTIEDRVGEAPNSTNNAVSLNMDFVDVVPDTP